MTKLGFTTLAKRLRTPFGEIDLVFGNDDWLIAIEVKQRKTLSESASALNTAQSRRLLAAFDYLISMKPDWLRQNIRFDLIIVDGSGNIRRVQDALRDW